MVNHHEKPSFVFFGGHIFFQPSKKQIREQELQEMFNFQLEVRIERLGTALCYLHILQGSLNYQFWGKSNLMQVYGNF